MRVEQHLVLQLHQFSNLVNLVLDWRIWRWYMAV